MIIPFIASLLLAADSIKLSDIEHSRPVTIEDIGHECFAGVFYASWCVACSGMMKQLLHDNPAKLICPISVDATVSEAKSYFDNKPELKILMKHMYFDKDGEFAASLKLHGIPQTVFFDEKGNIK